MAETRMKSLENIVKDMEGKVGDLTAKFDGVSLDLKNFTTEMRLGSTEMKNHAAEQREQMDLVVREMQRQLHQQQLEAAKSTSETNRMFQLLMQRSPIFTGERAESSTAGAAAGLGFNPAAQKTNLQSVGSDEDSPVESESTDWRPSYGVFTKDDWRAGLERCSIDEQKITSAGVSGDTYHFAPPTQQFQFMPEVTGGFNNRFGEEASPFYKLSRDNRHGESWFQHHRHGEAGLLHSDSPRQPPQFTPELLGHFGNRGEFDFTNRPEWRQYYNCGDPGVLIRGIPEHHQRENEHPVMERERGTRPMTMQHSNWQSYETSVEESTSAFTSGQRHRFTTEVVPKLQEWCEVASECHQTKEHPSSSSPVISSNASKMSESNTYVWDEEKFKADRDQILQEFGEEIRESNSKFQASIKNVIKASQKIVNSPILRTPNEVSSETFPEIRNRIFVSPLMNVDSEMVIPCVDDLELLDKKAILKLQDDEPVSWNALVSGGDSVENFESLMCFDPGIIGDDQDVIVLSDEPVKCSGQLRGLINAKDVLTEIMNSSIHCPVPKGESILNEFMDGNLESSDEGLRSVKGLYKVEKVKNNVDSIEHIYKSFDPGISDSVFGSLESDVLKQSKDDKELGANEEWIESIQCYDPGIFENFLEYFEGVFSVEMAATREYSDMEVNSGNKIELALFLDEGHRQQKGYVNSEQCGKLIIRRCLADAIWCFDPGIFAIGLHGFNSDFSEQTTATSAHYGNLCKEFQLKAAVQSSHLALEAVSSILISSLRSSLKLREGECLEYEFTAGLYEFTAGFTRNGIYAKEPAFKKQQSYSRYQQKTGLLAEMYILKTEMAGMEGTDLDLVQNFKVGTSHNIVLVYDFKLVEYLVRKNEFVTGEVGNFMNSYSGNKITGACEIKWRKLFLLKEWIFKGGTVMLKAEAGVREDSHGESVSVAGRQLFMLFHEELVVDFVHGSLSCKKGNAEA